MVISGLNLIKHLIHSPAGLTGVVYPDFFTESIGLWIIVCADYRIFTMEQSSLLDRLSKNGEPLHGQILVLDLNHLNM